MKRRLDKKEVKKSNKRSGDQKVKEVSKRCKCWLQSLKLVLICIKEVESIQLKGEGEGEE